MSGTSFLRHQKNSFQTISEIFSVCLKYTNYHITQADWKLFISRTLSTFTVSSIEGYMSDTTESITKFEIDVTFKGSKYHWILRNKRLYLICCGLIAQPFWDWSYPLESALYCVGKVFLLIVFSPAQVHIVSSAEKYTGEPSEHAVLDAIDHKAFMVMG